MVDSAGAELPVELLGTEAPEVLDGEGPEVQHVVPGEGVPLLQQHHLGPQEGQLDGRTQAAWSSTDDQTLDTERERERDTVFALVNTPLRMWVLSAAAAA